MSQQHSDCIACQHPFSPHIGHADDCHCLDVKCARCGKEGTSCGLFMLEEADEWECVECWERCEARRNVRRRAPDHAPRAPAFNPTAEGGDIPSEKCAAPYIADVGADLRHYVKGPGNGCGYYSGTLWPNLRWDTQDQAERAAAIANIAYQEGYEKAREKIRSALGVKS